MDHAVLHKEHEKSYLEKELRAFLDVIWIQGGIALLRKMDALGAPISAK